METTVVCSLVYLTGTAGVILARAKKGVSKNYYNGYGGKLDPGETAAQCAVREVKEESGVTISEADLRKACVISFHWPSEIAGLSRPGAKTIIAHIYVISSWVGQPRATAAFGRPKWFELNALPLEKMFPDDCYWLPRALKKSPPFTAEVWYRLAGDGPPQVVRSITNRPANRVLLDAP